MSEYHNEVVSRSAPRWAWEMIDETLAMDAQSKAFDANLRQSIGEANAAMMYSSENPELEEIGRTEVQEQME